MLDIYPAVVMGTNLYTILNPQFRFVLPENPYFDYLVMYPSWIGILIVIQVILIFIPVDIISKISRYIIPSRREKLLAIRSKIFLWILGIFLIYVPVRIIYDYYKVEVRNVTYQKDNLPSELDGFRIALIADIQADRFTNEKRISRFVEKVNSTKPELVLIAGDMITSTPLYIELVAEIIGRIRSNYGVFSCIGDHDNWAFRMNPQKSKEEIKSALKKNNVRMVDNGNQKIRINDAEILITFITNTYVDRPNNDVLELLKDSVNHNSFKILVSHQPSQFLIELAVKKNYNLFLSGHTHGGQITFLFPFFNLSPTLFETKYVRGDFWFGDLLLIVNRGLGMSLAPIRYNSTPEITVITFMKN
jgi:predicted MPP superfamily phosphohydrolase